MDIYIVTPGHFYEGFNSRVRGEGRWLVHMAGVLVNQGHNVRILSTDPVRSYVDKGVVFSSIYNSHKPDCDVMFSMDAWEDVPHLHKTKWSSMLNRFNPKRRVQALFFPTSSEVYDYIPVIHPWKYEQVRNGMGHCLPIITHEEVSAPGFDRHRIHWFSKHSDENPEYILGVMRALDTLVFEYGARPLFVDGVYIESQSYRNYDPQKEAETKRLFRQIVVGGPAQSLGNWAPYDFVRDWMASSKLMVGIHHPVAAPSMSEIAALGGFPVLFENQTSCAPYDTIDLPCIPLSANEDEVKSFILRAWQDESFFNDTVHLCQEAIEDHRQSRAAEIIRRFLEEL